MVDFQSFSSTTHPIVRLNDDWNNLLDHGVSKNFDYLVQYNSGSGVYQAISGATGKIAYGGTDNVGGASGTDATEVIQGALTALRSPGGKIFIASGTYPLTAELLYDVSSLSNAYTELVFEGAGRGTILKPSTEFFHATFTGVPWRKLCVRNLMIEPTASSDYVIKVNDAVNALLENFEIYPLNGAKIHDMLYLDQEDSYIVRNIRMNDSGVYDAGSTGIRLQAHTCRIEKVNTANDYGIYLHNGSSVGAYFVDIDQCDFEGSHGAGITDLDSDQDQIFVHHCLFLNNTVGIHVNYRLVAEQNIFYTGVTTKIENADILNRSRIRDNTGYITENQGDSTGTGAQQEIDHGCDFTPTYNQVFLSERQTGGALPYQSAAPDASHIYITATVGCTYNWRVSYSP